MSSGGENSLISGAAVTGLNKNWLGKNANTTTLALGATFAYTHF
jgi:hypothetical protein